MASLNIGSTSLREETGGPQFSMHASLNVIIACILVQLRQFSLISFIISVGMPHYKSLPVAVLGQTALLNLIYFIYFLFFFIRQQELSRAFCLYNGDLH